MMNLNDPRGLRGQLSRGSNIYNGGSFNSGSNQYGAYTSAAQRAVMQPPSMKNVNYAEVAKKWLSKDS